MVKVGHAPRCAAYRINPGAKQQATFPLQWPRIVGRIQDGTAEPAEQKHY